MTDYKAIKGKTVLHVSSDLGAEGEGEIWFNTATGDYKTIVKVAGAWASGGDTNTGRDAHSGGAGTQTAGLMAGGWVNAPGGTANSEEYNGTAWTEGANLGAALYQNSGAGTQTAGLSIGSQSVATDVQEYNGTSWAEGGDLPSPASGTGTHLCLGTQTAAISAGGGTGPGASLATSVSYDGSSWTELATVGNSRFSGGGAGTTTAGVIFGGLDPTRTTDTEEFDGSSWTEVNNMNTVGSYIGGGQGIQTDAMTFGGSVPAVTAKTEIYDGTTWTEAGDLSTARTQLGQSTGETSTGSGLAICGGPGRTKTTEEWDFSTTTTGPGAQNVKIITD